MSAGEEAQFETILKHLEAVVTDLEQIHSLKQMSEEAKLEVVELLQAVMAYSDIESIPVPAPAQGELVDSKEGKADAVELSQSGIVLVRRKGGENKATHLAEYKPATVIKVLSSLVPALKEEIAERRKTHERNLEALQSIKQSLSAVETRRKRPAKSS